MVQLMLKAGQFEVSIPARPAENVLGPDSDASVAQRLRSALVMRPRRPDFGEVPGVTPDIQVGNLFCLVVFLRMYMSSWLSLHVPCPALGLKKCKLVICTCSIACCCAA